MKNNRVDVVYDYFRKNKKGPIEFYELYKILEKIDKRFEDDPLLMSQLYTDIIIDGRFIMLREIKNGKEVHLCDIRENYTHKQIKESISNFGDIIDEKNELEIEEEKKAKAPSGDIIKELKDESTLEIMSKLVDEDEELDDAPVKDIDSIDD